MSERLANTTRDLGRELADVPIPASIRAAVMHRFDRTRRRRLATRSVLIGTAVAAAAVAGVAIRENAHRTTPAVSETQPFIAIPYTLPLDPDEPARIVRMSLPVPALTAAGFSIAVPDTGAQAEADVLVGEDGRPRAIRILSISNSDRSYR